MYPECSSRLFIFFFILYFDLFAYSKHTQHICKHFDELKLIRMIGNAIVPTYNEMEGTRDENAHKIRHNRDERRDTIIISSSVFAPIFFTAQWCFLFFLKWGTRRKLVHLIKSQSYFRWCLRLIFLCSLHRMMMLMMLMLMLLDADGPHLLDGLNEHKHTFSYKGVAKKKIEKKMMKKKKIYKKLFAITCHRWFSKIVIQIICYICEHTTMWHWTTNVWKCHSNKIKMFHILRLYLRCAL